MTRARQMIWSATAMSLFGCSGAEGPPVGDSSRAVVAPPGSAGEAPRPPHGPPPEALAACQGSSDGAPCSVDLAELEIPGACRKGPKGEPELACVPSAPPPGHPGPPPEAIDACKALSADASCSVKLGDEIITGKCLGPPHGEGPLACIPKDMPPQGPPPEALAACAGLTADAACSVKLPPKTIDGTCRSGPGGTGPLACAPKPLPVP
ncbi:MAG: hypothetical protein IT377_00530 [Polyangiaceae bacterium]|nr:hypothetical protein [Polyangiaceae bacterium]